MYTGNTVYRQIQIHCAGNDTISFGDGIPDSIQADWIASTLAKTVGLSGNPGAPDRRAGRGRFAGSPPEAKIASARRHHS